jgi:hypothetical protein
MITKDTDKRVRETLELQKTLVEAGETTYEKKFEEFVCFAWTFYDEAERTRTWAMNHEKDIVTMREAVESAMAGDKRGASEHTLGEAVYAAIWESSTSVFVELSWGKVRVPRAGRTNDQIAHDLSPICNGAGITIEGVDYALVDGTLRREYDNEGPPHDKSKEVRETFLKQATESK